MSLLPGSILPPSMPFGRIEVDEQGRVKGEGLILIEMNWWLLLYNLSQNVLGSAGGGGVTVGLPAAALIEIAALEADAADADAIAARPLGASSALLAQDTDHPALSDIAQLRADVNTALLLAQEPLLPDAIPQVHGFGTPTGTGVINNFPGATATLAQCSQAIAQIIKDLKSLGLYGV